MFPGCTKQELGTFKKVAKKREDDVGERGKGGREREKRREKWKETQKKDSITEKLWGLCLLFPFSLES